MAYIWPSGRVRFRGDSYGVSIRSPGGSIYPGNCERPDNFPWEEGEGSR